jgi:hypothetical protein
MDELCPLSLNEEVSYVVLNGVCAAQQFQLRVETNYDVQQKHILVSFCCLRSLFDACICSYDLLTCYASCRN